jgi:hypothetical protein
MKCPTKLLCCSLGLALLSLVPAINASAQISNVKTVLVIMMENHNWTGNNAGAAFGAPDIKDNPIAPFINGELIGRSAHSERYYNPPKIIPV